MARPYWTGQIQISLVSFGVNLFPATDSKSEIHFHQLNRKTGDRIKHQNVSGEGEAVENSDVVKGYEYRKGEYITVEPEEIENLRIPSRHTMEVVQFVDIEEISPEYFEKPYFVVPENEVQAEAFAVVRKALQTTRKVALGKIAFGGREHLVAIAAPFGHQLSGMMTYILRYAEELRDPTVYFGDTKKVTVEDDQLSLAKELIKRKSTKFDPGKFKDEYEAAPREMIEAKVKHTPIPHDDHVQKSAKVINLMDALRRSVKGDELPAAKRKAISNPLGRAHKTGIALVKPAAAKTTKIKRKSA